MNTTYDMMKNNMIRWSIAIICLLILSIPQAMAAPAAPGQQNDSGSVWEKWQPLAEGFMARRQVPQGLELAKELRQSSSTQLRKLNLPGSKTKGLDNLKPGKAASVWVYTGDEGLYSIPLTDLAVVTGINVNMLRSSAKRGRLGFLNADESVSWYFDADNDRLLFFGEKYETFDSKGNAYQIQQTKKADPQQMVEIAKSGNKKDKGNSLQVGLQTPFRDELHFEEEGDMMYFSWLHPSDPDARYWFWDYLFPPYKLKIEVPLYIPAPFEYGMARMAIKLYGLTDLDPGDDHEVYAELNGYAIGAVMSWDGLNPAELIADVDQEFLNPDGNNLLVLNSNRGRQLLESVSVTYDRLPVAENDQLWMRNVEGGIQEVAGFTSSDILVIESPVRNAILHKDVGIYRDGDGTWAVSFEAAQGSDYLIVETSALQSPAMDGREQANLTDWGNSADYMIIAPREFSETVQALAEYREAIYGIVKVVWLDDIYKYFSAGRQDPFAIGRFMDHVRTQWTQMPEAVMLVGKGSLDRKDSMGYGDNFLPVLMDSTPWALAPSDDRLIGFEAGSTPFAVGRLPITNDAEGLDYVDKLIAHEMQVSRGVSTRAVVVADNPDNGGDFHANADQLATELLGLGFESVIKLYHPTHPVRENLINSSTWASDFISYSGHGVRAALGNYRENFFLSNDAMALNNDVYPIFAALTCAAGEGAFPGTRSLAGTLVLNPQGGAIASLATTGLSLDDDAHILCNAFINNLYGGYNNVGDSLAAAKAQTAGQIEDFMAPIYTIIGDPSVQVR